MDVAVSGRCCCDPSVFMFMARLQLAITAYNYIIRDGGFTCHILGSIPRMDPVFSRYTTRDHTFTALMTVVDSNIVDRSRDINDLIALQHDLKAPKKKKGKFTAQKTATVNHVGIDVIVPTNQGLFSEQASIFSAISLFQSSFAPFLKFVINVVTLDTRVHQYVTELLSIDASAVKSSRGKLDYSNNNTCKQIYREFSLYVRAELVSKKVPRLVIVHPDFYELVSVLREESLMERISVMRGESV